MKDTEGRSAALLSLLSYSNLIVTISDMILTYLLDGRQNGFRALIAIFIAITFLNCNYTNVFPWIKAEWLRCSNTESMCRNSSRVCYGYSSNNKATFICACLPAVVSQIYWVELPNLHWIVFSRLVPFVR